MYNNYRMYPCHYCRNARECDVEGDMYNQNNIYPCPYYANTMYYLDSWRGVSDPCVTYGEKIQYEDEAQYENELQYHWRMDSSLLPKDSDSIELRDYGPSPFVVDINKATKANSNFRTALWTGHHLQVTLMSINPGEDIGLEIHPNVDQFIRIEQGEGLVKMGKNKHNLDFQRRVHDDYAIMIPAGTWHDVINTGDIPLKVYSIYAPPQHPHGTVHVTKADAEAAEGSKASK